LREDFCGSLCGVSLRAVEKRVWGFIQPSRPLYLPDDYIKRGRERKERKEGRRDI